MSLPSVALVGATGNLGSVIHSKLLAAGFSVTVLTRQGSTSTAKLPAHPKQTIKEVDYSSKDSIVAAVQGLDAVVSTISVASTGGQDLLIDGAIAAGIRRFIPSNFGSDIFHPKNINLPVYAGKIATAKYLEDSAKAHPTFTYTSIMNNAFFDWGMRTGFTVNVREHTTTLWNGGDRPFSTTTLGTVGDAIVAVLKNLDATANKTLKIHDAVVTQNQIIEIVKKIDNKEWHTTVKSIQEEEDESYAELKKPQPNIQKAMAGFIHVAIFGEGREVFASQIDNKMLGLAEMNQSDIEGVVRKVLSE